MKSKIKIFTLLCTNIAVSMTKVVIKFLQGSVRKNEGKINKRKEKNTVARRFGGREGLCFSEEGG